MHVKVKDTVVIITGKDKGKPATQVLSVDHAKQRAIVEQRNIVKKHAKADPRKGIQGGILEKEAPIHISNLMLVCPQCKKPTRSRVELDGDKRVRACRKCSARMDR